MYDNSMYWILGVAVFSALIMIVGTITSRNLPKPQKRIRVQKFAAAATALIFFSFPIFKPFVSSYSNARHLDRLSAESISSTEDIAAFNKKQAQYINDLTDDVKDLREDLYLTNRFYGSLTQFLSTAIATIALSFAFRKRKEENDLEEIQPDQISKL